MSDRRFIIELKKEVERFRSHTDSTNGLIERLSLMIDVYLIASPCKHRWSVTPSGYGIGYMNICDECGETSPIPGGGV